ncbi:hypothetical protein ACOMHN_004455 [Nucella lapillus]
MDITTLLLAAAVTTTATTTAATPFLLPYNNNHALPDPHPPPFLLTDNPTTTTTTTILSTESSLFLDHLLTNLAGNAWKSFKSEVLATTPLTSASSGGDYDVLRSTPTPTVDSSSSGGIHNNVSDLSQNGTGGGRGGGGGSLGPPYMRVEKFIVPTVCVMGIVLNVLNLLVLTERCLKESPYTYLTAMAVLCLASLIMSFLSYIVMHSFPHNYYCYMYTFHLYYPCVNICANSTMWLTAMLTIERFLFVRHPLWARVKCDRRSAKMKICIIIVLMMILNIPRFLLYKVVPSTTKGPGSYTYEYTDFRRSQTFVVISWIYSATIQLIPMSILCVFNFYLVYAVHRARRLRKRMQIRNNMEAEWSREQTRLTITLISIVFFFIICIMPSAFSDLHVAYALFGKGQTRGQFRMSPFYMLFQKISNLLVFCQLSFNFVLYSAFNDKFLAVFKRMLKRWAERVKRRVSGKPSTDSSMMRLMRLETMSGSGTEGGGGGKKNGSVLNHHSNHHEQQQQQNQQHLLLRTKVSSTSTGSCSNDPSSAV